MISASDCSVFYFFMFSGSFLFCCCNISTFLYIIIIAIFFFNILHKLIRLFIIFNGMSYFVSQYSRRRNPNSFCCLICCIWIPIYCCLSSIYNEFITFTCRIFIPNIVYLI